MNAIYAFCGSLIYSITMFLMVMVMMVGPLLIVLVMASPFILLHKIFYRIVDDCDYFDGDDMSIYDDDSNR